MSLAETIGWLRDVGREPASRSEGQSRRIVLAGQTVGYRLIRARRRSIGMQVGLDGLTVRAPRWVPLREIEGALQERAAWIVRSIAEWRARRREVLPRTWATGAPILYLGRELTLAIYPARRKAIVPDLVNLNVQHPDPDDEPGLAREVGQWLREEALRIVAPRAAELATRIALAPPAVKLSNARSEWGSCNAKGEIRLNWRLVQLPPELAHYVVAHEVAHLVHLDHSARFWTLVEALVPGHARAKAALDDWTALLEA